VVDLKANNYYSIAPSIYWDCETIRLVVVDQSDRSYSGNRLNKQCNQLSDISQSMEVQELKFFKIYLLRTLLKKVTA